MQSCEGDRNGENDRHEDEMHASVTVNERSGHDHDDQEACTAVPINGSNRENFLMQKELEIYRREKTLAKRELELVRRELASLRAEWTIDKSGISGDSNNSARFTQPHANITV